MTCHLVLLGGNGYIGRAFTQYWQQLDPDATFWVLSRSGHNHLTGPQIHNLAVDVTDATAAAAVVPAQFDVIVDFIGRPEKDPATSQAVNDQPALVMQHLAETHGATVMGFIGGRMGPRAFLNTKTRLIQQLATSTVPLAVVNPTLVYGGDRQDTLVKLVPFLRFAGWFKPALRPVTVTTVVAELAHQIQTYQKAGV